MADITDKIRKQMHGVTDGKIIATQGQSLYMKKPSEYPAGNPMTQTGKKVMGSMRKTYGAKKGKQMFYATANKYGKKWHK